VVERVSAVWMSISGIFNSHLIMAAAVQRSGTEEQKRRYLPRFASGELRGGIALTEPDCGTDLQAIRTHARREGDHYIVNGAKTWITNSVEGTILTVLVKTDTHAEPAHKGMSLLLIEKGPGFKVTRKLEKLGYRGIDTGEMVFEDCRVPAANLIGGEEGHGMQQVLSGLELGRINVAARGAGLARACLEQALRYAQLRKTFGKPIAEHQAIQLKLADMATRITAARLLTGRAAERLDVDSRDDAGSIMARLVGGETAYAVSLEAMRIHGGYGYTSEFPVERYYRDAAALLLGPRDGAAERKRLAARWLASQQP